MYSITGQNDICILYIKYKFKFPKYKYKFDKLVCTKWNYHFFIGT